MPTSDRSHESVHPGARHPGPGSRWVLPGTAVLIGLVYLGAGIAGGAPFFGIAGLGLMVVVAVGLLLLSRRSETVAGLLDRNDERINQLDASATVFAGVALIVAVLVMFVIEIARGNSGAPYYQLGGLAGVAYLLGLGYQRLRH